jgi:acetoin utilization protein AcuB
MPAVHDAALDETTVGDVMTRDVAVAGATDTLAFAAQASDVMRRHLLTVRPTCTLESAIAKLLDANLRHLVVVDDEFRLLGIVSDRDIRAAVGEPVRSLAMGGGARGEVGERRVETIMTRNPITVGPEASVTDVAEIFVDERIGAVPVVRKDDTVLGMISYVDVIAHFVGRRR